MGAIIIRLLVIGALVGGAFFAVAESHASANQTIFAPSRWITTEPKLTKIRDFVGISSFPKTVSGTGNRDCTDRTMVSTPGRPLQPEQSSVGCVNDTGFGALGPSGLLQRQGTTVYGPIEKEIGRPAFPIGIPRTDEALLLSGNAGFGSYYSVISHMDAWLDTHTFPNGTVLHRIKNNVQSFPITDRAGNKIALQADSMAFSANGRWLIADAPYVGFVRIDLQNRDVLPFGDKTNYQVAVNPGWQSAISPDGRYAVIHSREFSTFQLYDLATCDSAPDVITKKVNCQSKNLLPFMQQKVPGFFGMSQLRFQGPDHLSFYLITKQNGKTILSHQYLGVVDESLPGFEYLALGDSFASGEGAYQYKATTDTPDNMCHTSLSSYPYLLGNWLGYTDYESVACSGAIMEDIKGSRDYTGQAYPRVKLSARSDNDMNALLVDWMPGHLPQFLFSREYTPDLVTVSAMGNDIGFADIIKKCVAPGTCYDSYDKRIGKLREVDSKFYELVDMYDALKKSGKPNARIYAIGYPKVAKPDGDCGANVLLNRAELEFANDLVDYLNAMIERAAKKAGVFYVDVGDSLNGSRLCEAEFDLAFNGITAGRDMKIFGDNQLLDIVKVPIATESYHPNAKGHALMARVIRDKTSGLTAEMPAPQPNVEQLKVISGIPILDKVAKGNPYARRSVTADKLGQPSSTRGENWAGNTDTLIRLAPETSATVELHSTPAQLGIFITSAEGTLNFTVTIPGDTEPGFHTMTVLGKTLAGEDISLEKVVFVGSSEDDVDGDGTPNTDDSCPTISNVGLDSDKDAVDDVCDGTISEPPLEPDPLPEPTPEPVPDPVVETAPEPEVIEVVIPEPTTEMPDVTTEPQPTPIPIITPNPETTEDPAPDPVIDENRELLPNEPTTPQSYIQPAETSVLAVNGSRPVLQGGTQRQSSDQVNQDETTSQPPQSVLGTTTEPNTATAKQTKPVSIQKSTIGWLLWAGVLLLMSAGIFAAALPKRRL